MRACECDPTLDYGPNNAECPTHGEEVRTWQAWEKGESRCPYCIGLEPRDFEATCDCWQYERENRSPGDDQAGT